MENTFEIIQKICKKSGDYLRNNREKPDYIMIHPINKEIIEKEEIILSNINKIFGIKIIWTESIEKDEIICTFDANDKINDMKTKLITHMVIEPKINEKACKNCEHYYKYNLQKHNAGYCTKKCKVRLENESCNKYLKK